MMKSLSVIIVVCFLVTVSFAEVSNYEKFQVIPKLIQLARSRYHHGLKHALKTVTFAMTLHHVVLTTVTFLLIITILMEFVHEWLVEA